MISSLLAGVVFGLSAGMAPGPLFMLVISQTLKHNVKEGVKVALAPLVTDLPIIIAALFILSKLTDYERILSLISLGGGLYVLYLSYECFLTGSIQTEVSEDQPQSLRKGALINVLNPHPYLFWITVGSPFILKARESGLVAPLLFIAGFYIFLVGSKIFIAFVVAKSRTFLTSRGYVYLMRVLAGLLVIFALFLIKDAIGFLGLIAY